MKTTTHATLAALILAAAGQVQAQTIVEDMDSSGGFSLEELQTVYPDLTDETFLALDTDASGEVSVEELTAAQEAGLIGG